MMLDRALQSGRRLTDKSQLSAEKARQSKENNGNQESFDKYADKQAEYLKGKDLTAKGISKNQSKDNIMPLQHTPNKVGKKPVEKKSQVKIVFGKREPESAANNQRIHPDSTTKRLNTSYSNHESDDIALKPNKGTRFVSGQKKPVSSNRGSRVGTPSRNKKQMLSVQEEFYKYSQRGGTPQSTKSNKSIAQTETLDIYKKYGFLKNGKVKISQKTAKFICSRIRPTDCLLHVLDALFLALADDRMHLESKSRFQDYKEQLSDLSDINARLISLYFGLQTEPEMHSRGLEQANQYLDKFYADSIFCDLITVDHCKEIAWIVQGMVRYHQKNEEGTLNNTQIDQSEQSIDDPMARLNHDKTGHIRANSVDYQNLESTLTRTHENGVGNGRVAQFSYQEDLDQENPYYSESKEEYLEREDRLHPEPVRPTSKLDTLSAPQYIEEKDFVSFGRNDSGYISMTSNHDQSPEAGITRDSFDKVIDKHKEKVQEMMRQMYSQQENHLGYEDEHNERDEKTIQIENWGKESRESGFQGSRTVNTVPTINQVYHRHADEDDEEPRAFSNATKQVAPVKKQAVNLNHPLFETLDLAKKTFNIKSFIILKSQQSVGPSTISCLLSLMVMTGDIKIEEVALYSDWKDLRRILTHSKVDSFIPIAFKPQFLKSIPETTIRMAETLLSESQKLAQQEDPGQNYYISKLSSFLTLIFEVYHYAKRHGEEYSQIYSIFSEQDSHN